ncbi:MAG: hypothetical protein Q8O57_04600 [Kiritimatiellota bacterium]|nr:hypothetical protein [Kiritimatiellota bacterium]
MVVDRDYAGATPCGMPFSTLAGAVGGVLPSSGLLAAAGEDGMTWMRSHNLVYLNNTPVALSMAIINPL